VTDIGQADFQLLIDLRRFRIAVDAKPLAEIGLSARAEIGLSARIVDKNGKVVASRLFEASEKVDKGRGAGRGCGVQQCIWQDCN